MAWYEAIDPNNPPFKVGDKVRPRADFNKGNYSNITRESGKTLTISELKFRENEWCASFKELSEVISCNYCNLNGLELAEDITKFNGQEFI